MKLNSFTAKNVNGYLNYDITFFPDISFLIGINGSGKTSALKLILGLISPAYEYLNQIDFEYAELICSTRVEERDVVINAIQNSIDNTISISLQTPNNTFEPVIFPRYSSKSYAYDPDDISITEQSYKENFDSNSITQAIRKFATPIFLGLDRKIYEGRAIDFRGRTQRRPINSNLGRKHREVQGHSAIDSSLDDVQNIVFDYFRKIANEQPKISEEFKRKIFQLSFKFNDDAVIEPIPGDSRNLLEKKAKVLSAIKSLDISFLDYYATSFFDRLVDIIDANNNRIGSSDSEKLHKKTLAIESESLNLLMKWVNNSSQIKRIDEIIDFSQTYQEKISELRTPIRKLENIIGKFLKEGNKELIIAPDGEMVVKLNSGRNASIFELSSGEKQIIIMIAHLIFVEDQRPSGVFIIDEPELSLHIAWQDIFVDSIMEASPKTQFVLATHSPSIIAKVEREQFCQNLSQTQNA